MRASRDFSPGFDLVVGPGGYAWWYIDALSDDQGHALTLIAFIGSVFSPYYAHARRQAAGSGAASGSGSDADPENHCAVNLALYGRPRRWSMTERDRKSVWRDAHNLLIGPSRLTWSGDTLTIDIAERAAPVPQRVRGQIRVTAPNRLHTPHALDKAGRHVWQPIAPVARIAVELEAPALRWSGQAYLDSNRGSEPLERGFRRWDWSRAHRPDGSGLIVYDLDERDYTERSIGLMVGADESTARRIDLDTRNAPPRQSLPRSAWGIERKTRCDAGHTPRVRETLTDAPFYTRSIVETVVHDEALVCVHESLDLNRFDARWVQALLPFRMPRWSARPGLLDGRPSPPRQGSHPG